MLSNFGCVVTAKYKNILFEHIIFTSSLTNELN